MIICNSYYLFFSSVADKHLLADFYVLQKESPMEKTVQSFPVFTTFKRLKTQP